MNESLERLKNIQLRIENACISAGRQPHEVSLLAVSKRQPPEKVIVFNKLGLRSFGENQLQEALQKQRAEETRREAERQAALARAQAAALKRPLLDMPPYGLHNCVCVGSLRSSSSTPIRPRLRDVGRSPIGSPIQKTLCSHGSSSIVCGITTSALALSHRRTTLDSTAPDRRTRNCLIIWQST